MLVIFLLAFMIVYSILFSWLDGDIDLVLEEWNY